MKNERSDAIILVVDDNVENIRVISEYLDIAGFETLVAKTGETGLRRARFSKPDLILLDILMPGIDGFETCRLLKADPETADIPVIFITAVDQLEHKLKGFDAGGVDYVTKPFSNRELFARISAHLTIQSLRRHLQEEKERFQRLVEAASEAILIHDQGRIVEVNPSVERLSGRTRAELIGTSGLDLLTPESREIAKASMKAETTHPYEVTLQHEDGHLIPAEVHGRPIRYEGRDIRILSIRDMSWRRDMEALEKKNRELESERSVLRATLTDRDHFGEFVGKSPAMQRVYESLLRASVSDDTVIIYGETGTGKELAARTVFSLGNHYTKNFVAVNCGAIQEPLFESLFFGYSKGAFTGADRDMSGYFRQAREGILFLDEVAELTLSMQVKLLRVLQDGEYTPVGAATSEVADVRIVAATNQELRGLMTQGKIREDFFHRLHVIALEMPPLRRHPEDIPLLICHFMKQRFPDETAECRPFPDDLLERFLTYEWPGNVRELFNEIRRYLGTGKVELAGTLPEDPAQAPLPPFLRHGLKFSKALAAFEQYYLKQAMRENKGHRGKVAKDLGIDRKTLYTKLKKYGL